MIPLLFTPIGKLAGSLAILAIAWFGFAKHYERKGASRVVAQIEERNNANVKKAESARKSVDVIPDGRLWDSYRRD